MVVGTLNSERATWQATILTSSAAVTAMIMSASAAPACSRTGGCEAWPSTHCTSSVSLILRMRSGRWSMTVTSLSSLDR